MPLGGAMERKFVGDVNMVTPLIIEEPRRQPTICAR